MPAPLAASTPANTAPVAPAPKTAAPTAAPTQAAPEQTFEVKIDGQPRKFTRAEAERLLSKAGFADKVISQTKEQAKEWTKRLAEYEEREKTAKERAKANTEEWLKEHGVDPDEYVRSRVQRKVAEHEMTPEQKEAQAAKDEAAALKKQLAERDEKEKSERISQHAKRLMKGIEDSLYESVTRASLKPGPDIFAAIHDVMNEWAQIGLLDPNTPFTQANADAVVDAANAKILEAKQGLTQQLARGLKGQQLEEFLGKDVADELIRHRIELRRNGGKLPQAQPATAQPLRTKSSDGPQYKSPQQLREEREARMGR